MAVHNITFREAIADAIKEEMERDPAVFLMGEDIAKFGGGFGTTRGLYHKFGGERIIQTPISETAIAGFALGAAMSGMRPIAEIMRDDWMTICMDELVNQVAKIRYMSGGKPEIHLTFKISTEGGVGLGPQHSQSFEAWVCHVPGLKVVMPSNPYDAKGLLKAAVRAHNPIIYMEPVSLLSMSGPVPDEDFTVPIGKAEVKKQGTDVTVVAWGTVLAKTLNAAKTLAKEGIDVEVIDLRTLSPMDTETIINSVKKTGKLVVGHEANKSGGWGAEVVATVQERAFDHLDAPIKRVAAPDAIIPTNKNLEKFILPQEEEVIEAVKSLM
ncbi:alpha-ketoacid dehydrogenase subunit beta [Chloroflexota bacterium]